MRECIKYFPCAAVLLREHTQKGKKKKRRIIDIKNVFNEGSVHVIVVFRCSLAPQTGRGH